MGTTHADVCWIFETFDPKSGVFLGLDSFVSFFAALFSAFFFFGVWMTTNLSRHHHLLLFLASLGFMGSTFAHSILERVLNDYPPATEIFYFASVDGLASPALAAMSMTRLFQCIEEKPQISTLKTFNVFSISLVLIVGATRLCMQSLTLGLHNHHRSVVLFCDGLIAFWDLGCCLLVVCVYITRKVENYSVDVSSDHPCNSEAKVECNIHNNESVNFYKDGFLLANPTSVFIRIALVIVSASTTSSCWDQYVFGVGLPIVMSVDLRRKTTAFLCECCCPPRPRHDDNEDVYTDMTDGGSVVMEMTNFNQDLQVDNFCNESGRCFLVPRSKSEHVAIVANKSFDYFNDRGKKQMKRSCSCENFSKTSRLGPLDQVLSQLVGDKHVKKTGEERVDDDDSLQLDKLKASLSIQALSKCASSSHKNGRF